MKHTNTTQNFLYDHFAETFEIDRKAINFTLYVFLASEHITTNTPLLSKIRSLKGGVYSHTFLMQNANKKSDGFPKSRERRGGVCKGGVVVIGSDFGLGREKSWVHWIC